MKCQFNGVQMSAEMDSAEKNGVILSVPVATATVCNILGVISVLLSLFSLGLGFARFIYCLIIYGTTDIRVLFEALSPRVADFIRVSHIIGFAATVLSCIATVCLYVKSKKRENRTGLIGALIALVLAMIAFFPYLPVLI